MADKRFSLDDYIDVAERIQHFKEAYPDGSLQTFRWHQETVGDRLFIVYHALAYRTPDDERPGNGIAWEPFPGQTPYTRDSELMNAETAAWGRAIVALGITSNRKIASRQEVQARHGGEEGAVSTSTRGPADDPGDQPTDKQLAFLKRLRDQAAPTDATRAEIERRAGCVYGHPPTRRQVSAMIETYKSGLLPDPSMPPDIPTTLPGLPDVDTRDDDIPFDTEEKP